ncbi:putative methylesterase 15, chloroplastic [Sesamum angolense]|uniref:Methylesterase 15, chloroplastic n=1 Tax=Sesamum angolense TaxID=2727404 RepID=A0AAE1T702_9LAMI|nr:putative methylesterase 15, chloroplastic [Sesamum angolense]
MVVQVLQMILCHHLLLAANSFHFLYSKYKSTLIPSTKHSLLLLLIDGLALRANIRVWEVSSVTISVRLAKASSSSPPKDLLPPWLSPLAISRKSRRQASSKSKTEVVFDDSYIKQQAQIATMLYHHHLQNNGGDLLLHLERSISTKSPPSSSKKQKSLTRRSRSVSSSSPLSTSLQLYNQDAARSGGVAESKHFVLVHGGGFGAWCWYKIIALLKEGQCEVDAIDLTGSGANFCDINSITTLPQYAKPLTDFLATLADNKKSCLSDVNRRAQKFLYANGKNHQPTAIQFDESLLEDFLFNRTPSKDIALASVSMRAVPFAPVTQKLSLSASNYGSVSRFYIKTDDDFAIPQPLQEAMIQSSPPKQVFELKGSDHSPFFSRPQALHRLLVEISNLPHE